MTDPALKPSTKIDSTLPQPKETPPKKYFAHFFWPTFSATFITILLAEMGDKTQLAILLISAESSKPLTVFVGAALALISTSLVGVLVGWWLSQRVSAKVMDLSAAAILLLVSVLLFWDVTQMN